MLVSAWKIVGLISGYVIPKTKQLVFDSSPVNKDYLEQRCLQMLVSLLALKNPPQNTDLLQGLWSLTPLSAIFQLYRGDHFFGGGKPEYPEKTTDLSQVTNKLYLIMSPTTSKQELLSSLS